ncbi:hypothetical protein [Paenibacillus sp. Leaf72]|uniref:hypothetical protein n=1 Tax=Paenibacillus sp. Leaf72 TaxID=1736234 RepID=UPI0006F8DB79|nr:hypothetical protein [Paenibacillus sp. Leaf72]KQN96308.1 hypothetical protein ASF12_26205 [Paenibacillus sp. Leaf72]
MEQRIPLIAFVGTTPNIGTTTAAFAAAYRMAEASGLHVGYLCLHLKSAKLHRYLGIKEPQSTLDKLRPELQSGSLTPGKLKSAMHVVEGRENLRVLFGNVVRDQAEFFTPEEAEHLIHIAGQTFEVLFMDVSAYWDNAATVCALRLASTRIVVTTGALSHFQEDGRRWITQISPLFGLTADQYNTVIIEPPWGRGGYRMKDICKEMGTVKLGEMQMTKDTFIHLDSGKLGQWLGEDQAGRTAMKKPSQQLMERYGIRTIAPAFKLQPWYRKLLSHRNEARS